jgi:cell wall-associated NlpC family hydrolase
MMKLSKGFTLVGGGVPAVGILTACILNVNANPSQGHLAEHAIASPRPSAPGYAVVQPKSLTALTALTAFDMAGPQAAAPDNAAPRGTTAPDPGATPSQASPVLALEPTTREARPDPKATARQATPIKKTSSGTEERLAAKVVGYARAQLGKPYVYGAEGPSSFDCSGLVQAAYTSAGINVPRTSQAQYWAGRRVKPGHERPGDLVYFDYQPGHGGPGHVGIVLDPEKGLMIAAPHTGDHVKIQSYKKYPGGPVGFTHPV